MRVTGMPGRDLVPADGGLAAAEQIGMKHLSMPVSSAKFAHFGAEWLFFDQRMRHGDSRESET